MSRLPTTIAFETNTYSLRLVQGRLTIDRELDVALRLGPGELEFVFEDANVVDRDPPPKDTKVMELSAGLVVLTGMSATLHVTRKKYPDPPVRFRASPDVETMWQRYQGYRDGREPLLSMAYFCLTVVESHAANRKEAARQLTVDEDVLRKLGELTSTRGNRSTARKVVTSPSRDLTQAEINWIELAVKALIHRIGEADPALPCPRLSMKDLPTL